MSKSSDELGAELYELWFAGERRLPAIAEEFATAASRVGGSMNGESAFWRPSELSGPYGAARGPWVSFRDEVYDILKETADNLDLTGEALSLAAREYAKTDRAAAAKLEQLKHQNADVQILD
ncbi:MAG TPA: hypothetical protein VGJ53_03265 [Micromonosporaceae bacterium]|jgi:hypothetical protein